MRITGGLHKGVTLNSPTNNTIRPTADRVRESLFNILHHGDLVDLDGAVALDLFCGAGTLGLEALSRGAAACLFIDGSASSLKLCRQNAAKVNPAAPCIFLKHDLTRAFPTAHTADIPPPADIIFLDPPYAKNLGARAITHICQTDFINKNTLIVMEMAAKYPEDANIPGFKLLDERKYGDTIIRFYRMIPAIPKDNRQ